ncbi:hypothetical protein V5O48_017857 [Marasmius crinis-equi]|uniref:Origin recognition complex subunit 5 n=1 Tax=Marasmius crinis-equi TaxID=585013 RepID=A0ABR3EMS7_9AGAR
MLNAEHIQLVLDLLCLGPSSFIYINDITCPNITSSHLASALAERSKDSDLHVHHVFVDGVACFSSRILFDTVINGLLDWIPSWNEGCSNWSADDRQERYNESLDGFIHGIRAVSSHLQREHEDGEVKLVLIVKKPERLKDRLPEVIVPLTRLAETSQVDVSVVFISETRWEEVRPPLGAALDPFYVDIPAPTKEATVQHICSNFISSSEDDTSHSESEIHAYSPHLEPLYHHFISVLYDSCNPTIKDPQELQYIASARWPGFIKPILDEYERSREDGESFNLPSEDVRMRLTRAFKPSFIGAMEDLHPRTFSAADWCKVNVPEDDIMEKMYRTPGLTSPSRRGLDELDNDLNGVVNTKGKGRAKEGGIDSLPRQSKFILVASYIASSNPAKTDLRMFGRGVDEKKRKRRVQTNRATTKVNTGPVKIPQPLAGPSPFPLDRMLAILGALLEDNDVDTRIPASEYTIAGEYTDMEIGRVGTYAAVIELTTLRLLHRTTATDKVDGPPMFKCAISNDIATSLAKQLGVGLNELLWDPV